MSAPAHRVVLVSGAPASGKTTLAGPLADELGLALLSKDQIKETLHDALGAPEADLTWSQRLGAAAMELLWALAADQRAVVLEANFPPRRAYVRDKISALCPRPVEVYCACPPGLAIRRYAERAAARHPVHVVTALTADYLADYDRPVGIGDLITVDTTGPVDVSALAGRVRACWPAAGQAAGQRHRAAQPGPVV